MQKRIEEVARVMVKEKILQCEYTAVDQFCLKITLDPSALYQDEIKASKPDEEMTKSDDDYEEFLFNKNKMKEAKLQEDINNL